MDSSRLKGRPSFPFETIAVAIAFSPRLEAVLAEATRLSRIFGASLLMMHVGKRTVGKEEMLGEILARSAVDPAARVVWLDGDPVDAMLQACKENLIDLLVLGALRRENVLRYYLGSVARGMSRRAKCSLLLLTEPAVGGTGFGRIVVDCVDHEKTPRTLDTVRYFAGRVGCHDVRMVREADQTGLAMSMSDDGTSDEQHRLREMLFEEEQRKIAHLGEGWDADGIAVERVLLHGRPGYAIRRYAEDCRADLLAINSPDGRYGLIDRIFTHGMEHILEHLPCNLLIVHSRLPERG